MSMDGRTSSAPRRKGLSSPLTTVEIMKQMGLEVDTVKAGKANMFLSPLFREVFAMITGACVELYNTDGSQGAARGAGLGAGIYRDTEEAFVGLTPAGITEPDAAKAAQYKEIYLEWEANLKNSWGKGSLKTKIKPKAFKMHQAAVKTAIG